MVFAEAQRAVTTEGESVESVRVGACLSWEFERVSAGLPSLPAALS